MQDKPAIQQSDLTPKTASVWLDEARAQQREGELFRAYDLATQGLAQHPDNLELKHCAVLSLASTGATRQAKAKFTDLGLDKVSARGPGLSRHIIMDIATLRARLAKDEALQSQGAERRKLLMLSADLYEKAYRAEHDANNPEAYYPAVN